MDMAAAMAIVGAPIERSEWCMIQCVIKGFRTGLCGVYVLIFTRHRAASGEGPDASVRACMHGAACSVHHHSPRASTAGLSVGKYSGGVLGLISTCHTCVKRSTLLFLLDNFVR